MNEISTQDKNPPRPGSPPRPRADADGAAIAALIMAFLVPPLGIVFGFVSRGQAKRRGLRPSAVASWGAGLGIAFTLLSVLLAVMVIEAFAPGAGVSYADCVNNAILAGQDPSAVCTP